ncbi:prolyl oligopeptidase family serine peptidase [Fulvivirga sp. M361]|uniref:carboxylesterase family protein n=1 Tax=Fulvivirga sp. M361 TaxID=2594266 RepID=UPI00117AD763|nr:prolyl oligopeptidase family serine peptidase [Fulvivirga sp. M361]TRX58453.1 prolyl oligopeptidase family serine peptidase [Fulvivirga sp. M361]
MNKYLFLIVIISICFSKVKAQDKSEFKSARHQYKGGAIPFRILYPLEFDTSKKYPLVFFLHGAGERGNDNKKQLVHGSKLFLDASNRSKYPAIVVMPQCATEDFWANVEKTKVEDGQRSFTFNPGGKPTPAMKGALSLLDSLTSSGVVDKKQMYVGGLSMGGMGTFEMVCRRPNTFAAAIPICGGSNPESVKKYAKKVSFWVFHGAKDNVVPPIQSEQMVEAIRSKGGDVKFSLYPEANHNSWDKAFGEPELLPWLFSQKK